MSLDELLSHFPGAKKDKPDHWMARCPAHEAEGNHIPSLSITYTNEKILLHCFAGCSVRSIVDACGLKESDLFFESKESRAPKKIVKTYDYKDLGGTLLFQVVRFEPKDFRQRRPDGNGGWIYDLKGVTPILYRLADVTRAIALGETIYLTEGEKDADTIMAGGLVATCNPMGAKKWRPEYTDTLRSARLVIVPDADNAGLDHARLVYESVRSSTASVRVLLPPGGCKDITEYTERVGITGPKLRVVLERLAEVAPNRPPAPDLPAIQTDSTPAPAGPTPSEYQVEVISDCNLRKMTFVPPREVIPGIVHSGVTILAGGPKVGKSYFCLGAAQAVAHGGAAFGKIRCPQGDALCFFMEDGGGRLQGRLKRLDQADPGGDLSTEHLNYVFDLPAAVKRDRRLFADKVLLPLTERMPNLALVIVDTLTKIRPRTGGKNQNLYEQDYDAIEPFQELAKRRQVAVVFVHHTRKMLSEDPLEEVSGTMGLTGSADNILVIKRKRFERRGVLSIISRDIGETALSVDYDESTGLWSIVGPADQLAIEAEHQEILEILTERPSGMEPHLIGREIGKTASGARKVLKRMYDLGLVSQDGAKFYAQVRRGKKSAQERLSDHIREDDCQGVGPDGQPCKICEKLFNEAAREIKGSDGRMAAAGQ